MSLKFKFQGSKFKQIRIKLAIILAFAASLTVGCNQSPPMKNTIVISESKSYEASLFRQNCAVCHGAEANGKQMNERYIPSLRYGHAATISEEEIYFQIKEGKMPMPAFKNQLSEDEIRRMVKFIMRDLQGREITN